MIEYVYQIVLDGDAFLGDARFIQHDGRVYDGEPSEADIEECKAFYLGNTLSAIHEVVIRKLKMAYKG